MSTSRDAKAIPDESAVVLQRLTEAIQIPLSHLAREFIAPSIDSAGKERKSDIPPPQTAIVLDPAKYPKLSREEAFSRLFLRLCQSITRKEEADYLPFINDLQTKQKHTALNHHEVVILALAYLYLPSIKDIPKAFELLQTQTTENAYAMLLLGKLYLEENFKNFEKAFLYFKHAEKHIGMAFYFKGKMYDEGLLVKKDEKSAFNNMIEGANKKDSYALYWLANYYDEKGDLINVQNCLMQGATQGNFSCANCYVLLKRKEEGGLSKIDSNLFNISKLTADQGAADGMYNLGSYAIKQPVQAAYFYHLAKLLNLNEAQQNLEYLYHHYKTPQQMGDFDPNKFSLDYYYAIALNNFGMLRLVLSDFNHFTPLWLDDFNSNIHAVRIKVVERVANFFLSEDSKEEVLIPPRVRVNIAIEFFKKNNIETAARFLRNLSVADRLSSEENYEIGFWLKKHAKEYTMLLACAINPWISRLEKTKAKKHPSHAPHNDDKEQKEEEILKASEEKKLLELAESFLKQAKIQGNQKAKAILEFKIQNPLLQNYYSAIPTIDATESKPIPFLEVKLDAKEATAIPPLSLLLEDIKPDDVLDRFKKAVKVPLIHIAKQIIFPEADLVPPSKDQKLQDEFPILTREAAFSLLAARAYFNRITETDIKAFSKWQTELEISLEKSLEKSQPTIYTNIMLGLIYFFGLNGKKDLDKALNQFKLCEENAYAKIFMGWVYFHQFQEEEAFYYLLQAEQEKIGLVFFLKANMYVRGSWLKENNVEVIANGEVGARLNDLSSLEILTERLCLDRTQAFSATVKTQLVSQAAAKGIALALFNYANSIASHKMDFFYNTLLNINELLHETSLFSLIACRGGKEEIINHNSSGAAMFYRLAITYNGSTEAKTELTKLVNQIPTKLSQRSDADFAIRYHWSMLYSDYQFLQNSLLYGEKFSALWLEDFHSEFHKIKKQALDCLLVILPPEKGTRDLVAPVRVKVNLAIHFFQQSSKDEISKDEIEKACFYLQPFASQELSPEENYQLGFWIYTHQEHFMFPLLEGLKLKDDFFPDDNPTKDQVKLRILSARKKLTEIANSYFDQASSKGHPLARKMSATINRVFLSATPGLLFDPKSRDEVVVSLRSDAASPAPIQPEGEDDGLNATNTPQKDSKLK